MLTNKKQNCSHPWAACSTREIKDMIDAGVNVE
jgi:hypothetical protein